MQSLNGKVEKIKVLKLDSSPLVRFTLDGISCLIKQHSLSFLANVGEGSRIAVCGSYNKRGQFVVRKYSVIGKKIEANVDKWLVSR